LSWQRPVSFVGDIAPARMCGITPRAWAWGESETDAFNLAVSGRRAVSRGDLRGPADTAEAK